MALTRPILRNVTPFPATVDNTIYFDVYSGDQVLANEMEIQKNADNTQVFLNKVSSFQFQQTIPANTLINGTEYKIRVRTYNSSNQYSDWSDWVIFWCFSIPSIGITNIVDGIVNNQTFTFQGSYSQAENEQLESYRYLLYDDNKSLIQTFSEHYDTNLSEEITGLENDTQYYIELKVITVHEMESTSGLVSFKASYIQPRLSTVLNLENLSDKAAIKITANIIQIIGKTTGTTTFEDNNWINVKSGSVYFDDGFNVNKDFTLKLWIKDIPENTDFLNLYGILGQLRMQFYNNRIHVFKGYYNNDLQSHYGSNVLDSISLTDDILFIFMQQVKDQLSIVIELLTHTGSTILVGQFLVGEYNVGQIV